MDKISIPQIKARYKMASTAMFFLSCFFATGLMAQGERHRDNGPQGGGAVRQAPSREPSFRQQAPINRPSSQFRDRQPATPMVNPDRAISQRNNNVFNRPNNNNTIGRDNNFNRPGNGNAIRPNNTRPGDITYNRPGNNNYNSRPGYGNNYNRPGYGNNNRPGYNFNNGNRDYRGYNNYNNYRRPVYNAGNPNWRYAYAPRRYSIFNTLPSSYFSINFGGSGYRYNDGIFYRPYNNVFRVVPPPIGIFVNVLPFGYSRIYVHDYPYYYYNGTYYDYRDNNYTVVSPPVGAVVESLPDGYETVTIDGETYYTVDGAQYKPVTQDNGEIWYEVIKAN